MDKKTKSYVCPLCKGRVVETPTFWGCENYKEKNCNYKVFKTCYGVPISKRDMRDLLTVGTTRNHISGFYDRIKREPFSARLKHDHETNMFIFEDKRKEN